MTEPLRIACIVGAIFMGTIWLLAIIRLLATGDEVGVGCLVGAVWGSIFTLLILGAVS